MSMTRCFYCGVVCDVGPHGNICDPCRKVMRAAPSQTVTATRASEEALMLRAEVQQLRRELVNAKDDAQEYRRSMAALAELAEGHKHIEQTLLSERDALRAEVARLTAALKRVAFDMGSPSWCVPGPYDSENMRCIARAALAPEAQTSAKHELGDETKARIGAMFPAPSPEKQSAKIKHTRVGNGALRRNRCEACGKPATHTCSGLDVPWLLFCLECGNEHALACPDIASGAARLEQRGPVAPPAPKTFTVEQACEAVRVMFGVTDEDDSMGTHLTHFRRALTDPVILSTAFLEAMGSDDDIDPAMRPPAPKTFMVERCGDQDEESGVECMGPAAHEGPHWAEKKGSWGHCWWAPPIPEKDPRPTRFTAKQIEALLDAAEMHANEVTPGKAIGDEFLVNVRAFVRRALGIVEQEGGP